MKMKRSYAEKMNVYTKARINEVKDIMGQMKGLKEKLGINARKFHLQLTMCKGVYNSHIPNNGITNKIDEIWITMLTNLELIETAYYDEDDEKVMNTIDNVLAYLDLKLQTLEAAQSTMEKYLEDNPDENDELI